MESLNFKHLLACLFGVLISIWGVYLFNTPTYCGPSRPTNACIRLARARGTDVEYGNRPYGVILFVVGVVFTFYVYRLSKNEKH
jgi:hypothetical protein